MVKMTRYERPKTNKQQAVTLHQTNKLIVPTSAHFYPYATGGKTGYHRRARHNLAATAEKDGRRLIAVVLSCEKKENRFHDTKKLFEAAFQEEKTVRSVLARGAQAFQREVSGGKTAVSTYTKEALSLSFYPSEEPEMRCQLVWDKVVPPIKKGDRVGELLLLADNIEVKKIALLSANDVEMSFSYAMQQKCAALLASSISLIALGGLLLLALYFLLTRKRA